jgi:Pyridoxamine 5'-phosphate oxidase
VALLDLTRADDRYTAQRLSGEPVIWLGPVRPDGHPHNVPVWFAWHDPMVLIFRMPGTVKARNGRRSPAVSLSPSPCCRYRRTRPRPGNIRACPHAFTRWPNRACSTPSVPDRRARAAPGPRGRRHRGPACRPQPRRRHPDQHPHQRGRPSYHRPDRLRRHAPHGARLRPGRHRPAHRNQLSRPARAPPPGHRRPAQPAVLLPAAAHRPR